MNYYKSRYTGTQIDSLLDKVKEDVVSKEDINTDTFNPTSDNPASQKSIAGAMEKLDQSLQNQIADETSTRESEDTRIKKEANAYADNLSKGLQDQISSNKSAISSLETRTKNLEDTKVNINTGTFDPDSDNPAGQRSIAGEMEKKQNRLTFDDTPRMGSSNPVTSEGIKMAVEEFRPEVIEIQNSYYNLTEVSTGTQIMWTKFLIFTKTANTTFTFETAKENCSNEYKAKITNGGSTSIILTFTGVTNILCNDDNCVILNNTLTLPTGVTIEISVLYSNMVAINFEA